MPVSISLALGRKKEGGKARGNRNGAFGRRAIIKEERARACWKWHAGPGFEFEGEVESSAYLLKREDP